MLGSSLSVLSISGVWWEDMAVEQGEEGFDTESQSAGQMRVSRREHGRKNVALTSSSLPYDVVTSANLELPNVTFQVPVIVSPLGRSLAHRD
jgi:hypothetical protein